MASSATTAPVANNDIEAPPSESTPLMPKTDDDDDEPPPLKEMKEQSTKEKLVAGAAAVTFASSVGAMVLENNPTVYVSGVVGSAVAPYAVIQQQKLTQCEALAQTNERMGEEVAQLKEENVRLQTQVQSLETSVENLAEMKNTLATVKAVEGQSLDELERQLQESHDILDNMQDNLRGDVLQNMISVLIAMDDGDGQLSDDEMDTLISKVEGIQGVDLKEDLLRQKLVENGRSMSAVMEVARNLLAEDTPPEENIFSFVEKQQ